MAILCGDALTVLSEMEDQSVNCCVTSPPYWGLRDYGNDGQLGLEATPDEYVANMVRVFAEVRRVLRDDGTLWLNLGDSYAAGKMGRDDNSGDDLARRSAIYGSGTGNGRGPSSGVCRPAPPGLKPKDLVGIPWRVAFALQADGWYLRSDIIWAKPNPMPESVTDRPTKAHEYVFLMTKSARYWYDAEAVREDARPWILDRKVMEAPACGPDRITDGATDQRRMKFAELKGANRRTVWTIATQPYPEAHFATYPEKLVEPCVLAGCPVGGIVLDPFTGSGTTGAVAYRLGRKFVGIELNPEYAEMAERRIAPHRDQMQLEVLP